jgi:Zinc carboxypeptidase
MPIKPVTGRIVAQELNDNFSYLDSLVDGPINSDRFTDNSIASDKLRTSSDAEKVKLINLADEVIRAITGNASVNPTIGNGSITTEKYAPESITIDKVKKNLTFGMALKTVTTGSSKLDFDFSNKLLTMQNVRIQHGSNSYYLNASFPQYNFSTLTGDTNYLLYYDTQATALGTTPANSVSLPTGAIVVGAFHPKFETVTGIHDYTINGADLKNSYAHGFYSGDYNNLDFDFRNRKIHVYNNNAGRVIQGNKSYSIVQQTIDLEQPDGDGYDYYSFTEEPINTNIILSYNIKNGLLETSIQAATRAKHLIPFAAFSIGKMQVFNVDQCLINGKLKDDATHPQDKDKYVKRLKNSELYTSPVLEDASASSSNPIINYTSADVYGAYDSLVSNYPDYITKTLVGNEATGLPIYRYDFVPDQPDLGNTTKDTKIPKFLFTSSSHPSERAGWWGLYNSMKKICENWENDEQLETLRWNVVFSVIPILNPWGLDNGDPRKNSNGVDINRSFPFGWSKKDPAATDYGGETPLSELEAQYLANILKTEKDIAYYGDFHNFFSNSNMNYFVWNIGGTLLNNNIARTLVTQLSRKWSNDHISFPQNEFMGHASMPTGGSTCNYAGSLGIESSIFEVCEKFLWDSNEPTFSSNVIALASEAQLNWLYIVYKNLVN